MGWHVGRLSAMLSPEKVTDRRAEILVAKVSLVLYTVFYSACQYACNTTLMSVFWSATFMIKGSVINVTIYNTGLPP